MKFRSLPVILLLSVISVAASAQNWTATKIIDSVTVLMPGTPTSSVKQGQEGHQLVMNDSTKLTFLTINFEDFGLTEDALAAMLDTDEFSEQYKSGIASQGEVVSEKKGKLNDKYTWYEYEMKTTDDKGKSVTTYIRTTFYKAYGIATVYTPGLKGLDAAIKDKYFGSLVFGK